MTVARATDRPLRITILGLSITSSWGNGHATIFRALVRALVRRGHEVCFLERDVPWYAANRDLGAPQRDVYGRVHLYRDLTELRERHTEAVRDADLAIVGSYVPDGVDVGEWVMRTASGVRAFYDIDTPITLAKLERGEEEYISAELLRRYDVYFTFTGGPVLEQLRTRWDAARVQPLYCCVDPQHYYPEPIAREQDVDLGYMGTYSADRQPKLERLLIEPARHMSAGRFVVAGPQYPETIAWPANVRRIEHLPPDAHRAFYHRQRFTLNLTRDAMVATGHAPSVRLFEAAACGTPVISDSWAGLETFFKPGEEILVAEEASDVHRYLEELDESTRRAIGERARQRVLAEHTAEHRARQIERQVRTLAWSEKSHVFGSDDGGEAVHPRLEI